MLELSINVITYLNFPVDQSAKKFEQYLIANFKYSRRHASYQYAII